MTAPAPTGQIEEVPFQYGTCQRCGWDVTRDPGGEWSGQFGGDCRSGDDAAEDGVHVVAEVRDGIRLRKLIPFSEAHVAILGDHGQVISEQTVPQGGTWEEWFTAHRTTTGYRVIVRPTTLPVAVTDEEEAAYWTAKSEEQP